MRMYFINPVSFSKFPPFIITTSFLIYIFMDYFYTLKILFSTKSQNTDGERSSRRLMFNEPVATVRLSGRSQRRGTTNRPAEGGGVCVCSVSGEMCVCSVSERDVWGITRFCWRTDLRTARVVCEILCFSAPGCVRSEGARLRGWTHPGGIMAEPRTTKLSAHRPGQVVAPKQNAGNGKS